jgi:DNA-directed RNA polymerase beta subunit
MEKDAICAHGAAEVCRDRLFLQSDPYLVPVCERCQLLAESAAPPDVLTVNHSRPYCQHCKSNDHVQMVPMPYAAKLFLQEITALHIAPRLELEDI